MGKQRCFGGRITQSDLVLRTVSTDCCSLGAVGGIQSKISGIGLRRAGFESAPLRAPETPFNSSQDIFLIVLYCHNKTLKAGCFLRKVCHVWWGSPAVPATQEYREQGCCKFLASLVYEECSRHVARLSGQ